MRRHWVTENEKKIIWELYLRNKNHYKHKMKLYEDIGKFTGHKWQAVAKVIWAIKKNSQPQVIKNQLNLF